MRKEKHIYIYKYKLIKIRVISSETKRRTDWQEISSEENDDASGWVCWTVPIRILQTRHYNMRKKLQNFQIWFCFFSKKNRWQIFFFLIIIHLIIFSSSIVDSFHIDRVSLFLFLFFLSIFVNFTNTCL